MKSRRVLIGAATIGAAAAIVASASPALAFPGFSATTGNPSAPVSTAGTVGLSALSTGSLTLQDVTAPTSTLSCTTAGQSGATASATRGTSSSNTVGAVTATKFGTATPAATPGGALTPGSAPCTGAGAFVAVVQSGSWPLSVTAASTPAASVPTLNQVTPGLLSNINATVWVGPSCKLTVAGTAAGSYKNTSGTGTLTVASSSSSPTLSVTAVTLYNGATNCAAGALNVGDKLVYNGVYSASVSSNGSNAYWLNS